MYTISTQLAKAVFDIGDFFYKDSPTESIQIKNGIITYTVGKSSFDKPVDSFFFMCKNWAVKYSGWTLQSYTNEKYSGICRIKVGDGQELTKAISNSEQQAVFDACQYILDTKGI